MERDTRAGDTKNEKNISFEKPRGHKTDLKFYGPLYNLKNNKNYNNVFFTQQLFICRAD